MPKQVWDVPAVRLANGSRPTNPVSEAVADVVNDLHGVTVIKELKRAMADPVAPAVSPVGEQLGQTAQAMGNLTSTVVAASKGLVDSYQGQASTALQTAKFEADRRQAVEERMETRVQQAIEAEERKAQSLMEFMIASQNRREDVIIQLGDAKAQATAMEYKSQVDRLMERLDYQERRHEDQINQLQEKLDEANYSLQHRPQSFEEKLLAAVVEAHGGNLAKALPVLLGGQALVDPDREVKLAQAEWYKHSLANDLETKRLEAEGRKKMMEDVGEGAKQVGGILTNIVGGALGIPIGASKPSLLPDEAPPPRGAPNPSEFEVADVG